MDAGWGTALLARHIGDKRAREMWFLNEQYTAQQAYEMGLVNKVVPLAELDAAVKAWTDILAERSPTALALAKRSFNADSENIRGISLAMLSAVKLFYETKIQGGRARLHGEAEARLPRLREVSATSMAPRRLDPDDIASVLPRGGRVLISSCSGNRSLSAERLRGRRRARRNDLHRHFRAGLNTGTGSQTPPAGSRLSS